MLTEERHNEIAALVAQNGSVRVKDLSQRFGVTEDCIRKDLTQLQKRGILKKTYGGAMRIRSIPRDFHVADRKGKHLEDKQRIAGKALELVKDGDTIFLDISTSNIELAKLLAASNRKITLVTNCIDVILTANMPDSIRLIGLGGEVSEKRDGFVGALTNEQLSRYNFDIAFMGVVGVDLEKDCVSTYIPDDGTSKIAALQNSRRSYMMLETRKFYEDSAYRYGRVSSFTGAIMEKAPDDGLLKQLERYPIDWRWAK